MKYKKKFKIKPYYPEKKNKKQTGADSEGSWNVGWGG